MCAAHRRVRLSCAPQRVQRLPQQLPTIQSGTWRAGKTSTERGYGYRWQQYRASYLEKHPLCVMCQEQCIVTAATVVDHKVPHQGDQRLFWEPTNHQSLCKPCHDGRKQREERGYR